MARDELLSKLCVLVPVGSQVGLTSAASRWITRAMPDIRRTLEAHYRYEVGLGRRQLQLVGRSLAEVVVACKNAVQHGKIDRLEQANEADRLELGEIEFYNLASAMARLITRHVTTSEHAEVTEGMAAEAFSDRDLQLRSRLESARSSRNSENIVRDASNAIAAHAAEYVAEKIEPLRKDFVEALRRRLDRRSKADADEIVSNAVFEILTEYEEDRGVSPEGVFGKYIRYATKDFFRKRSARPSVAWVDGAEVERKPQVAGWTSVAQEEKVKSAMRGLRPHEIDILIASCWEDLQPQGAAQKLALLADGQDKFTSADTVSTTRRRCMEKLKGILTKDEFFPRE